MLSQEKKKHVAPLPPENQHILYSVCETQSEHKKLAHTSAPHPVWSRKILIVVRVSPHISFNNWFLLWATNVSLVHYTMLFKNYQAQEFLNLTKFVNDLELTEWYPMDVCRGSCQISQNLDNTKEKENKWFLGFFNAVSKLQVLQ